MRLRLVTLTPDGPQTLLTPNVPGARQNVAACPNCAGPTHPVSGVILERWFPGRLVCDGCGQLVLHCRCSR